MSNSNINKVLKRGVVEVYPSRKDLAKILRRDPGKLTFYHGIDPTAPFLHLGHTVPVRKLEQLRQIGCKVILLVGNFTATIGDPTEKESARPVLSLKEVEKNAKRYLKMINPVLNIDDKKNPVEVKKNNEWWGKMSFREFMELAQKITAQRLLERDMFQRRIEKGAPIYLHELTYPLLQGYDSVAMKVDGEVGGNDQTFNMLMGRDLTRSFLDKEKYVISTKLLVDPSGKKMSKTEGNAVPLDADASDMFGVVMSWPDEMIAEGFELLTDVDMKKVKKWGKEVGPRNLKAKLALEITKIFHGEKKAQKAEDEFEQVFQKGSVPEDIEEIKVKPGEIKPIDLLVTLGLAKSNSDARRVIEQGGMRINDEIVENPVEPVEVSKGDVVQRGKRRFIRIG